MANAIRLANPITPVGTLEGARQTLTIEANRQMMHAAEFARSSWPRSRRAPPCDEEVADVQDSVEVVKAASWADGDRGITLAVRRQPDANTVTTVDSIRRPLPQLVAQMPTSVQISIRNDRSVSIRAAIHDVKVTLGITAFLVVGDLPLPAPPSATIIPALSLPISLLGTLALMQALISASTTCRCWASRSQWAWWWTTRS